MSVGLATSALAWMVRAKTQAESQAAKGVSAQWQGQPHRGPTAAPSTPRSGPHRPRSQARHRALRPHRQGLHHPHSRSKRGLRRLHLSPSKPRRLVQPALCGAHSQGPQRFGLAVWRLWQPEPLAAGKVHGMSGSQDCAVQDTHWRCCSEENKVIRRGMKRQSCRPPT